MSYPVTPDEVYAMVTDQAFQEAKCAATGAVDYDVSITGPAERAHVLAHRIVPTDVFPDFAKSIVGPTLGITETWAWDLPGVDGSRRARLEVRVGDLPVGFHASVHMVPTSTGTRLDIDGDLKARIPLLGSKVERAAEPAIDSAIRHEQATGDTWLAG